MFRVLPLLLMIGLIALAPLAVPAQDKDKVVDDKKVDDKKVDDKKADDKKADDKKADDKKADDKKGEDPVKPEPPVTPVTQKSETKGTLVEVIPGRMDYALSLVPVISLLLIAILFVLVLSLRSSVNQLEEKIKGGS